VQKLTDEQVANKKVQVILNPLPPSTVFTTRVSFHNLRPEEFGALCWALTWGGAEELRHSIGMGKPFGFGQLRIEIISAQLMPNRRGEAAMTWQQARDTFIAYMDERHRAARNSDWRASPQIRGLLGMADAANAARFKGELRHMKLEAKKKINEFTDAKQTPLVLGDYPTREHPETMAERAAVVQAKQEREEARRREEERRARMSPLEREVEEMLAARPDKNQSEASALIGALKSERWAGEERRQVAEMARRRMLAAKTWKPTSQAKKPEKDKDHQNTLLVMKWLEW
jgi:hypothetical protein